MSTILQQIDLTELSKKWLSMLNFWQLIHILSLVITDVFFIPYLEYSTNMMKYARDSLLKNFNASP